MSAEQLLDAILGGFPPDVVELLADDDGGGDVLRHLRALAQTLAVKAEIPLDELARDISPLRCGSYRLAQWEYALGMSATRTARFGTLDARRNAVISRLREYGAPTVAMIQAVLAPLLGYADPSQLTIVECDRLVLRAAHTYSGKLIKAGFTYADPAQWWFWVNDSDRVAPGCAQVDLRLTAADLARVAVDLRSPDGTLYRLDFGQVGEDVAVSRTVRLYFRGIAAASVLGLWKVAVWQQGAGLGTIHDCKLFCEGTGRGGRSAAAFEWAAVFEPAKSSSAPDFDAAHSAARRVSLATRIGGLVIPADASVGLPPGDFGAIPNDNTIPGSFLPGAP